ncbi:MAG: flavin monoamine oxidase family protein [Actinomycetota bacterium]
MRDVIVVGGGLAGLTAARELRHDGLDVLVLEARERLGGRAWTIEAAGHTLELGGAYVTWHQPHVWAGLTRYGLGVTPSRTPARAAWVVEGERREDSYGEFDERLAAAVDALCADARSWFPTPYDIPGAEAVRLDSRSVRQCIDASGGDAETCMLNEVAWGVVCQAMCSEVSAASAFVWYALSGYDAQLMKDCTYTYVVTGGIGRLVEAIASDGSPEIRLGAPVARLEHTASDVTAVLRNREVLRARAAVVATPVNTWSAIDFDPPLSDGKRELAARGHAGHGVKVMIRVRGRHDLNVALPETYPLNWLQPDFLDEDETIFLGFGSDGNALTPGDDATVMAALDSAIPGLEVLQVIGHDWEHDEFSQGTWSMYRPGELTGLVPAGREAEGRIAFAGADLARGWLSLIDGAIETGLTAAITTRRVLDW